MNIRDVPLSFLPTFEAAGRLGSFAAAAAELHLTPSAVSQQIRALEGALGVRLFERTGRAALLTNDGEHYLRDVRHTLQALSTATARLRRRSRETVLRISTVALAAYEFILPRLAAFQAAFPGIRLCVETSNDIIDFDASDFDAGLRVGAGWEHELCVHPLGQAEAAPVCAPALAERIHALADLNEYPLLDALPGATIALQTMLQAQGIPSRPAANDWQFESCYDTLRAAEHRLGVAMAVFPVATPWVKDGRLAVPLSVRVPLPGQVCFVHRHDDARFPFSDIAAWFAEQYQALPALPPGRQVPAADCRA